MSAAAAMGPPRVARCRRARWTACGRSGRRGACAAASAVRWARACASAPSWPRSSTAASPARRSGPRVTRARVRCRRVRSIVSGRRGRLTARAMRPTARHWARRRARAARASRRMRRARASAPRARVPRARRRAAMSPVSGPRGRPGAAATPSAAGAWATTRARAPRPSSSRGPGRVPASPRRRFPAPLRPVRSTASGTLGRLGHPALLHAIRRAPLRDPEAKRRPSPMAESVSEIPLRLNPALALLRPVPLLLQVLHHQV